MPSSKITLTHTDGSSNAIDIPLITGVVDDLPAGWERVFEGDNAPQIAIDGATYQDVSPANGIAMDFETWDRGFGLSRVDRSGSRNRYGYTDGVLAMFDHQLMPSYQEDQVDLLIRNGRMDVATDGWTAANTTVSMTSNTPRSRKGAFHIVVGATNGTLTQTYGGTISALQSREITIGAYAIRKSGSGTCTLTIDDGVGTTVSSAVSSTSEHTAMVVTRTLDGSATKLDIKFTFSANSDEWDIDDCFYVPTGGNAFIASQDFEGNFYLAAGRGIYKWDESTDAFVCQYLDASKVITDMRAFTELGVTDVLLVARGNADQYLRSTTGAVGSFAAPGTVVANNSRYADKFAVVLNANGDEAMMKVRNNFASMSVDTNDTGTFGGEMQVGDVDKNVNKVFEANDTAYIGKENGLYAYDSRINRFRNIEPQANFFSDPDNFSAGIGRGGALWASGGDVAFWKITPTGNWPFHQWEDHAFLFNADAFLGFGGRITSVTTDRTNLWVAMADNAASNTASFTYTFPMEFATAGDANQIRIILVRNWRDDETGTRDLVAHTVTSINLNKAQVMARYATSDESNLFICGSQTNYDLDISDVDEARVVRIRLPLDNENPRSDASTQVRKDGSFYTPWIDWNYPDVEKALVKLTVNSENFGSGTKYVTVSYKTDDATNADNSGWTPWGDDGIFDTSPTETKAATLTGPATFRRVRLKIDFTSDSFTDDPPVVTSYVLHAFWNPIESRRYRAATIHSTDRRAKLLGRPTRRDTLHAEDIANLEILRQEPFCILTDPDDGSTVRVKLRFQPQRISQKDALRSRPSESTDLYLLDMREVRTT